MISENETLYSIIGTTYGGHGTTTFCLPDLRGRSPLHYGAVEQGSSYPLGSQAGAEQVTLAAANIPMHTHAVSVSKKAASFSDPSPDRVHGDVGAHYLYCTASQSGTVQDLSSDTVVRSRGDGKPHNNIQPSIGLQYVICVDGSYPQYD